MKLCFIKCVIKYDCENINQFKNYLYYNIII